MRLNAETLNQYLHDDLYAAGMQDINKPISSIRNSAMLSLSKSFMKKFHNEVSDQERDGKALALFLECNERCKNFTSVQPRQPDEELVLGEMRVQLDKFFSPNPTGDEIFFKYILQREPLLLNMTAIARGFGWGSGSNIGSSSADFYTKLANSTMSHTDPSLLLLFKQATRGAGLWNDIEDYRSKTFGSELVAGNRLSFVPKSREISRTICTEPLLNMLFQKGIASVMERRLKEVFAIDLSNQPDRNRRLACSGSVTGRFGTIDLSSASDSISLTLCRTVIPKEPLNWLLRCRSPSVTLPGGEVRDLHMISSMGNGYTFPLQTTIFACLVSAVYRVAGIKLVRNSATSDGNFAVFGDDIIVDSSVYDLTVRCLEVLGFTVNRDKSFNEGSFRESCGSDFLFGHNIRGVYLRKLLTDGDCYSTINRLIRWSARHGILLPNTIGYLRSGCRFIGVPLHESDDSGIKIPLALFRKPRRDSNGAIFYLARVIVPARVRIPAVSPDSVIDEKSLAKVRVFLPRFQYDSNSLLASQIVGHLRGGHLTLRVQRVKSVLRKRRTPCWEYDPFSNGESHPFHHRWKAVVEASLVS